MGSLPLIAAIVDIVLGLTFIGISIPLVLGKIPMNHAYGIRFAKSFESEELWFRINRYGGKQLIIWSIPIILLGLAVFIFPALANGTSNFLLVCCVIPTVFVLIAMIMSYQYAKKQ
jgi:hypothetical protein